MAVVPRADPVIRVGEGEAHTAGRRAPRHWREHVHVGHGDAADVAARPEADGNTVACGIGGEDVRLASHTDRVVRAGERGADFPSVDGNCRSAAGMTLHEASAPDEPPWKSVARASQVTT